MQDRFVIVTQQRSGSNMFVSMLDNHPAIECFGELMRVTPGWMKRQGYRGALRVLEKVDAAFQNDRYRFNHPYEFVREAFETKPGGECYGFKLHLDQHPDFLKQLLHDPDWKIVVLRRENALAQYSSWKIAASTGQGNARKGDRIARTKVRFKQREFQQYVNRIESAWEAMWSELADSGKPYCYVRYLELISSQKLQELLGFIGVDPTVDIEPETAKRNSSDIISRFSNPDEVAETLAEMDRLDWKQETVQPCENASS